MIWESVMVAARYGLANLTMIVDANGLQQYGWPLAPDEEARGDRRDPLAGIRLGDALVAFGWDVNEIDGHDMDSIVGASMAARDRAATGRPMAILATTVKGRGVSFTEGRSEWHSRVATADEAEAARLELAAVGEAHS
jgi:transketolase